jgi:hypothetical protein
MVIVVLGSELEPNARRMKNVHPAGFLGVLASYNAATGEYAM